MKSDLFVKKKKCYFDHVGILKPEEWEVYVDTSAHRALGANKDGRVIISQYIFLLLFGFMNLFVLRRFGNGHGPLSFKDLKIQNCKNKIISKSVHILNDATLIHLSIYLSVI